MANWVLKGLRTGIRTTSYPGQADELAPGSRPAARVGTLLSSADQAESSPERCPTGAIVAQNGGVAIDHGTAFIASAATDDDDAEADLGTQLRVGRLCGREREGAAQSWNRIFGRSLHIRFVDAGACGACMSEARQINNPYYNMHRLGFFITPTPRNADVLLVAGPVSDAMRLPLRKTYEAMPAPKRVVAIGACAISGGVFGPSFAASGGAAEIIPVDVVVPGCPPPPLAILHALLLVVERKPPSALRFAAARAEARPAMSTAALLFSAFFILCGAGAVAAFLIPARWNPSCLRRSGHWPR